MFKNMILDFPRSRGTADPIALAGVIYTDDRDPSAFFTALSKIKKREVRLFNTGEYRPHGQRLRALLC